MINESLLASEEREAQLDHSVAVMQVMETHIDGNALAAAVDQAAPRPGRERGGRPPFPIELIVRALILQRRPGSPAARHRGYLDQKAGEVGLRVQSFGQRGPALQANLPAQGQHGPRT